jgi:hypothetical protein
MGMNDLVRRMYRKLSIFFILSSVLTVQTEGYEMITTKAHSDFSNKAIDRRRSNEEKHEQNIDSCEDVNYKVNDEGCQHFRGLGSWTEEFLDDLCSDTGVTNKGISATVCLSSAWTEETAEKYNNSLKLAILNQMYGSSSKVPNGECKYVCMWDPMHVYGDDLIGFIWTSDGCWEVYTAENPNLYCTKNDETYEERKYLVYDVRWCVGAVCESYGDPHMYDFSLKELPLQSSTGDYLMYYSSTMRIDVRMRPFYTNNGALWSKVSGIHAIAIKVIDGACNVTFEVYNQYQIANGSVRFLFNREEVKWSELASKFGYCSEICAGKFDIDEDNQKISITFADKSMISMSNLANMHAVFLTVATETVYSDTKLGKEPQICNGDIRLLDCNDDKTILSYYDWDKESMRYKYCNETPDSSGTDSFEDCDPNIEAIAWKFCTACDSPCQIPSLVESCKFDICMSPGVMDAWDVAKEEEAKREAQGIADDYCTWAKEESEEKPWLCPAIPTSRPTDKPAFLPTRSPTVTPTQDPTTPPPTENPTLIPTMLPTDLPTSRPTETPTNKPTKDPTPLPSVTPTEVPSSFPTLQPTPDPSESPTLQPTPSPTVPPSPTPTQQPTESPTVAPTDLPTWSPTSYRNCPFVAYKNQSCELNKTNNFVVSDFYSPDSNTGLQNCAEKCFRVDGTDWLLYDSDNCVCVFGSCTTLISSPLSTYRILPCDLVCNEIASTEWWGQNPSSKQFISGGSPQNSVKGLRFTSEINADIYMVGIEMELTDDDPPQLKDSDLRITPVLYFYGIRGRLMPTSSGDAMRPAFVDGYNGQFGNFSKLFLGEHFHITSNIIYTVAFEFVDGEADIWVSDDTSYYNDGDIVEEVFPVRGDVGVEPHIIDRQAPHVVFCYRETECEEKKDEIDNSTLYEKCGDDGMGEALKWKENAVSIYLKNDLLLVSISRAIANFMFEKCDSTCIYDPSYPISANYAWDSRGESWRLNLDTTCLRDPFVMRKMLLRSFNFCSETNSPTPIPTVSLTDLGPCEDFLLGEGTLLGINVAHEMLDEICDDVVGNNTVKLDGGYVYRDGDSCIALKTDAELDYDFEGCARVNGETEYCDFGDLLLTPDFGVYPNSTVGMIPLINIYNKYGGAGSLILSNDRFGFEITAVRSLEINAVGLYILDLLESDRMAFEIQDKSFLLDAGIMAAAYWNFAILEDADNGDGVYLESNTTYTLRWSYPTSMGVPLYNNKIFTAIRCFHEITLPILYQNSFRVNSFITGRSSPYQKWFNLEYYPMVNFKFCRAIPTPSPTATPTAIPTSTPTDLCVNIYINLVSFDPKLYDLPTWYTIFGGNYVYANEIANGLYIYKHGAKSGFMLSYTGKKWNIHDESGYYNISLSHERDAALYYPPLDGTSTWHFENKHAGYDQSSGQVNLYIECDSVYPPTSGPTIATIATERPTDEEQKEQICGILEVTYIINNGRSSGLYHIAMNGTNFEYRNGKPQWKLQNGKGAGDIFWLQEDAPIWPNSWVIFTMNGYLTSDAIVSKGYPDSGSYHVYSFGKFNSTSVIAPVKIVCATQPPTHQPSPNPSFNPTESPTYDPTPRPTQTPTARPTQYPSARPTGQPSLYPTSTPTLSPSPAPTPKPTASPTPAPTYREPCTYLKLASIPWEEFNGEYKKMDTDRNDAPQWQNDLTGYMIFYLDAGVFRNRWTIQASGVLRPRVSDRDYYVISPVVDEDASPGQLHAVPSDQEWQVFSADTWHTITDLFININFVCSSTPFPSGSPSEFPTYLPTVNYPCIYLNATEWHEKIEEWSGVYTRIMDPELKNGKIHYSGPTNNELYWMQEGVFGQRWILAFSNRSILVNEDVAESVDIPHKKYWQWIVFSSCVGHCVSVGDNINITVTYLDTCAPSFVPTPAPFRSSAPTTRSPTRMPSLRPTVIPTESPSDLPTSTEMPSLMPTPAPTALPTMTNTPEPTEHPTPVPTDDPTTYPTLHCACLRITGDGISGLLTMINERNYRFQWEDGETGWTLYWLEKGVFEGNWILQGYDHDHYWAHIGRKGDGMPPFNSSWQKFRVDGFNLASDEFTQIIIDCRICEPTATPTQIPTIVPTVTTRSPTLSPTCNEHYISMQSCCGDEFEGIYARRETLKNGKFYYENSNGYILFFVHDGLFENHWVAQSPDHDYVYLIEHSGSGDEPTLDVEQEWKVYRGASFTYISLHNVTVSCSLSSQPTRIPTGFPSPLPTFAPTRNPSPSPTIFPTINPTPMPSTVPSPSPSRKPSTVPSQSPTALPTTLIPSFMPSMMPSPSPTHMPTRYPTAKQITVIPTSSPTTSPSDPIIWCNCISVNAKEISGFDGIYVQNGRTWNQHYVWQTVEDMKIYWGGTISNGISWIIQGVGLFATYEDPEELWLTTPPLGGELSKWMVYDQRVNTSDTDQLISLTCIICEQTRMPTRIPTPGPSIGPSTQPTSVPTPISTPTPAPSVMPSPKPTALPTTPIPSLQPSALPSPSPSASPSTAPSLAPTVSPTPFSPTPKPSLMPSPAPSAVPTLFPSPSPTKSPTPISTDIPSLVPSLSPTLEPSLIPTQAPSNPPSSLPTTSPTEMPTNHVPSTAPSAMPSPSPTALPTTLEPSTLPSMMPSPSPSLRPSIVPSPRPTEIPQVPTLLPTLSPTKYPTLWCPCIFVNSKNKPELTGSYHQSGRVVNKHYQFETADGKEIYWSIDSDNSTNMWVISTRSLKAVQDEQSEDWNNVPPIGEFSWDLYEMPPLAVPESVTLTLSCDQCLSASPTTGPTINPTIYPTSRPTISPSPSPSVYPTPSPTILPSTQMPTGIPSTLPSPGPTALPTTSYPTPQPSIMPSRSPSPMPSAIPTTRPTDIPTPSSPTTLPSAIPSPSPTKLPTANAPSQSPSAMPSPAPSSAPSSIPSPVPTKLPTVVTPTSSPSAIPTPSPTKLPTASSPTSQPSVMPSPAPSSMPSVIPTPAPTKLPTTLEPTEETSVPSIMPSTSPTPAPTTPIPSPSPSLIPTPAPSPMPSSLPTLSPSKLPETRIPTPAPSTTPSSSPSLMPSALPTPSPTSLPTASAPSSTPSAMPSPAPTMLPSTPIPSLKPSAMPSSAPSVQPSAIPTPSPTKIPTTSIPSNSPSLMPSPSPSPMPSVVPTRAPTKIAATRNPSPSPSTMPSPSPTLLPTYHTPTSSPSTMPSPGPSPMPSSIPSSSPSKLPTALTPSSSPSFMPTPSPTQVPTTPLPSSSPSAMPSPAPSLVPSVMPTSAPSNYPTVPPTLSPTFWELEYCQCIKSNSTNPQFNSTYKETGLHKNNHWMWRSEDGFRIYWEDNEQIPKYWILEGNDDAIAMFKDLTGQWVLTPPLLSQEWQIFYNEAIGFTYNVIELVCIECPATSSPAPSPSPAPSAAPTIGPSPMPSVLPTPSPTKSPTKLQTQVPSLMPSPSPTLNPLAPTLMPSPSPTGLPTTQDPSPIPSAMPSPSPTKLPSIPIPSRTPSLMPSPAPSATPSSVPSPSPSRLPTTLLPSAAPSLMPTPSPTRLPTTSLPSSSPSLMPSPMPSEAPSTVPSLSPTKPPSYGSSRPTPRPSQFPSHLPSPMPSVQPTPSPSELPTTLPPSPLSAQPTVLPTKSPSPVPSLLPTPSPTDYPTSWCMCVDVNATDDTLSGEYRASGHVFNQHYHWETNDEKYIYWTMYGYWAIVGHDNVIAMFGTSDSRMNIPPMGSNIWRIHYQGSISGIEVEIILRCTTCTSSLSPSIEPTKSPTTPLPTYSPSLMPSPSPSPMPSVVPSPSPSRLPTTPIPTISPSLVPSPSPTFMPVAPTSSPSLSPTSLPTTLIPSQSPSVNPSSSPTKLPSTPIPSSSPSSMPSPSPSLTPSALPTSSPSELPTVNYPTSAPSVMPTPSPTKVPTTPTPSLSPSLLPTPAPSAAPTLIPSPNPTALPTLTEITLRPSVMPSQAPSSMPSNLPSPSPTELPTTNKPSPSPSLLPSPSPSQNPTLMPTYSPVPDPTFSLSPTDIPHPSPTSVPTQLPTWSPTIKYPCLFVNSTISDIDGTYTRLPELINRKSAWSNGQNELYISGKGVFEDSWVIHNKATEDYFVFVMEEPYRGDSYPPLGVTSNWQHFSDQIVPNLLNVEVTINYQTSCSPTQSPSPSPTPLPTVNPTEGYLCVIITWDINDGSYNIIPSDFYGAYYYRSIYYPSNNDFAKFPIYPTVQNGKPIFTKKLNRNSIRYFIESDGAANEETWVIDSQDHNYQLVSSRSNKGYNFPYFVDQPLADLTTVKYRWALWSQNNLRGNFDLQVEMSSSLETCEMFDTNTPTKYPSNEPTRVPTLSPSSNPTQSPSPMPSGVPSKAPTSGPSVMPTPSPTASPTSKQPTQSPTKVPTQYPTLQYQCINITATDSVYDYYNGVYSVQEETRNGRVWFTDGNTGFNVYYVENAVMIDHAWIVEGQENEYMSIYDVDLGTWTKFGQSDEVPPFGTSKWKQFKVPPKPTVYELIELHLEPIEICVPTQGPTKSPTDFPTASTPSPTTPSPTGVPTISPSSAPSTPPTATPTANPTEMCRVLVIQTPDEFGGTSVFEGNYIVQSIFKNGKLQWYNSNNRYSIFFVDDDWLPSSWVFQGDYGMDELTVFDDGTDGHPNTIQEYPDGEDWLLFYWDHNLQKRDSPVKVKILCLDSLPPTNIPTPSPSDLPSKRPTQFPSPMPSSMPSPSPSSMPSAVPSPSPSQIPSAYPSSSPTSSPTLITNTPTGVPTTLPSSYPTDECPCIIVNSTSLGMVGGVYQLQDDLFNAHSYWINYDNLGEISWAKEAVFEKYWVIAVDGIYAVKEIVSENWEVTPPIGSETWLIFVKEKGVISGGIERWLELDCTTCTPTPAPTPVPTILSTSPTLAPTMPANFTTSPTVHPNVSPTTVPSSLPSAMPTPSPTMLPTTLDPTATLIPTIVPTRSPTNLPTITVTTLGTSQPSSSPSPIPSSLPSPRPTVSPIVPTSTPSLSPSKIPTTAKPSASPSLMPSPSPSPMPSAVPSLSPTALPTTLIPTPSPSISPSPSPSPMPSLSPSPSPTLRPTLLPSVPPTNSPTEACLCLAVEDPESLLSDFVGVYRYMSNNSPNSNRWMWERPGDSTKELIYFSKFGASAGRWIIKGSNYGEWAETSADESEAKPPEFSSWLINLKEYTSYRFLYINCSQCENTPLPTPDPTETPTAVPTTLIPTDQPTPMPSIYCRVLNITDLTNGFYTGMFEMQALPYNGKRKWTDIESGESLFWVDTAMFEHEGPIDNIWMIGYTEDQGEQDSHFIIFGGLDNEVVYPHIDSVDIWLEYTYNTYSNQNSSILINCEETVLPTVSPTLAPSYPICLELFVWTCCDPVYSSLNGVYRATAHRGGKDMYYNVNNQYYILYTNKGSHEDSTWSIRSEDEVLIWVETSEENGPYPPFHAQWDLKNHLIGDLEVDVYINCSESFSPSVFPTPVPTELPTSRGISLNPTPMPTAYPTSKPTLIPTLVPTDECTAISVTGSNSEVIKYGGIYARQDESKNGKAYWVNYGTGGDLHWIDRGIWRNTWMMRASDGEYLLLHEKQPDSTHPPLVAEWLFPGREFIIHGKMFHELVLLCTAQPPGAPPTVSPTLSPTCVGNAIYIDDPCDQNITGGEYGGYYNYKYTKDGKNVYVSIDGEHEVLYISDGFYSGNWMIRSYESDSCDEFWVVGGYSDLVLPPKHAFWEAYKCGCVSRDYKYRCNFRIRCMHTMAPIPTEFPTIIPTLVSTDLHSSSPTSNPTTFPTSEPTTNPTPVPSDNPSFQPTTSSPTQSPLDCVPLDIQPCGNITGRGVHFTDRDNNRSQITSNYYETMLYTEQKGYSFVARENMVLHEAAMAFINLASYQTISVRLFDSSLIYESDYSLSGKGITGTTGSPRGDYYKFQNINIPLLANRTYTLIFVIQCPATKTNRAEYPLCAPNYEPYSVGDFATDTVNVYAYGVDYNLPTTSDLYAPFVRVCYSVESL